MLANHQHLSTAYMNVAAYPQMVIDTIHEAKKADISNSEKREPTGEKMRRYMRQVSSIRF